MASSGLLYGGCNWRKISDWPVIKLTAERDDYAATAAAFARAQTDADCHLMEALARESTWREENATLKAHIAALEAALSEQAFVERIATNGHALERTR